MSSIGIIALVTALRSSIALVIEFFREDTGKRAVTARLRVLSTVCLVPVGMRWTSGVVFPICSGWAQLMFGNGLSYNWLNISTGCSRNPWMLTVASYAATYSIDDGQAFTLLLTTLIQLCAIGAVVVLGYEEISDPNQKSDTRPNKSVSKRVAEPAAERQLEYDSGYNSSGDDVQDSGEGHPIVRPERTAEEGRGRQQHGQQQQQLAQMFHHQQQHQQQQTQMQQQHHVELGIVAKMNSIPVKDIEHLFNDFDDDDGLDPELKAAQDKELAEFSSRLGVSLLDAQTTQ